VFCEKRLQAIENKGREMQKESQEIPFEAQGKQERASYWRADI
jgi:hypothetical protein